MIECVTCKKKFKPFSLETNQAYQCSTEVYEDHLLGHYGSFKWDGVYAHWLGSKPESIKAGVNCDDCVDEHQAFFTVESKDRYW